MTPKCYCAGVTIPRPFVSNGYFFNRAEEARDVYFARLDRLAEQGFIDASTA
ncbi:MAG: hypothetical protein R3F44_09590 [Candidatus Competibacteraceae bacterium]